MIYIYIILLSIFYSDNLCCSEKVEEKKGKIKRVSTFKDMPVFRRVSSYKEVYDPLVQAVVEGNLSGVKQAVKNGCDPHQRIFYGFNLRHLAYKGRIDAYLKDECEVAPRKKVTYPYQETYPGGGVFRTVNIKGRDPKFKDVYGKFPEDYTRKQKKEFATRVMTANFIN